MRKILIGAVTAVVSYTLTTTLAKKEKSEDTKDSEGEYGNLVWISADEVRDEGEPIFNVGDTVVTFNPYTHDYAEIDLDWSPIYFEVQDVFYDENDGVYRYKLDENEWFAESWLMKPEHPYMNKSFNEEEGKMMFSYDSFEGGKKDETEKAKELLASGAKGLEKSELKRRKAWKKRMDELLDEYNGYVHEGETEKAEEVQATYQREQALFNAGSVIRELGGELGGERE